jgi:hypothetical protein
MDRKQQSLLSKRREENKSRKIIIIQRKWREYIIRKRYKIGFNYSLCNKSDIARLCKLKLYSELCKDEGFKKMIMLTSHLYDTWTKLCKTKSN